MINIKEMRFEEKVTLAREIRTLLVETVLKTGGHLASSLGAVELCIALHSVFDSPRDKIVFDVGHQAYAHKIITDRKNAFENLKLRSSSPDGISGFPRRDESVHDAFIGGHGGNGISAALGFLSADNNRKAIAVVGDGTFVNGEVYEALCNVRPNDNLVVILNDNGWSISKSQGVIADLLTKLRTSKEYVDVKERIKSTANKPVYTLAHNTKKLIKNILLPDNLFENLGFYYFGTVDGHNLRELDTVFENVKRLNVPCLIHLKTVKGKGYEPAEKFCEEHHGVPRKAENLSTRKTETFTNVFGNELVKIAEKDIRIFAVTAAMTKGTGLTLFSEKFPERFRDTGMTEEHSATFCAALSCEGFIPVFALYSTFCQRVFDQMAHDISLQKLHVIFALDRAGYVDGDGETHNGLLDIAMFSSLNATIYSPESRGEFIFSLNSSIYLEDGLVAIRYPKDIVSEDDGEYKYNSRLYRNNSEKLFVTYGRAFRQIPVLCENKKVDILKLVRVFPFDEDYFEAAIKYSEIIFVEECRNGISARFGVELFKRGFKGSYKWLEI